MFSGGRKRVHWERMGQYMVYSKSTQGMGMYELNTQNIIYKFGIESPAKTARCHEMVHQQYNKSCPRATECHFKILRKKNNIRVMLNKVLKNQTLHS